MWKRSTDYGDLYIYDPNKGAPVFFAIAFAVSGSWHLQQCIRYKCFKIIALYPFTCLLFTVGFALREYGTFHQANLGIYMANVILIFAAPPIIELANYHILGRILYYVPYCAPLHPGRTLTTFGSLSAAVETLNGLGVAWIANPELANTLGTTGHWLLRASLLLQFVVIGVFVCATAVFQRRCIKKRVHNQSVKAVCLTLYISTVLVLIRCIFRTVEQFTTPIHQQSARSFKVSPLSRHEWWFYMFDVAVLLINTFMWNFRHPRYNLPEDYHLALSTDGVTESKDNIWRDDRPFLLTLFDPVGIFTQRKKGHDKSSDAGSTRESQILPK